MDRRVYFSIDDAGPSLRYLTRSGEESIFALRFYGRLREWHRRFGARFDLYCFSRLEDFSLSLVPDRYAEEFRENGDWLRFGFHGLPGMPFLKTAAYQEEYALFRENAQRLGMAGTDVLRVHYWNASPEQAEFLRRQGIRVLLAKDDPEAPGDPGGTWVENGLERWRTNVRFERLPAVTEEALYLGRERVVAFTHEWAFDGCADLIEEALTLYQRNGYRFCCERGEATS